MRRLIPAMRVSFGLIMAVVSIILLSDMLGIIPDRSTAVIDGRKKISETLAIQYSLAARRNDYDAIEASMRLLVNNNEEVLSAALRNAAGVLVTVVGEHEKNWDKSLGEKSTPVQIQVPIYTNALMKQKWGNVELRFTPTSKIEVFGISVSSLAMMTVFVGVIGFLVFLVLIKRILTSVDPSSVVPSRVRKALDTLNEGVLLIDNKGRILFSNEVFSKAIMQEEAKIIGKSMTVFDWQGATDVLPWTKTLELGESTVGDKIGLAVNDDVVVQFVVNCAPVLDDANKQQGAMLTFDDVTELEARNNELRSMVSKLKSSSDHINKQNEELRVLATRDPLTDCLNRRTLFGQYEEKCLEALTAGDEFNCMMLDIDHFKQVNDTHGHAAGDEVLRVISRAIKSVLRSNDEVFRYGGEEFCVILPGSSIEAATGLAERVRECVEAQKIEIDESTTVEVTASIGMSSIRQGVGDLQALIELADIALYESKRSGRNKVTVWSDEVADLITEASSPVSVSSGTDGDIQGETGLPNRIDFKRVLASMISYAERHHEYAAVLLMDIDMFKRINNVFGYSAGDEVLETVSRRLCETIRDTDASCRLRDGVIEQEVFGLGGDEFGVLLTGLESKRDVMIVVDRLIEALTVPVVVDEQELFLTCSFGVSQFPDDGTDADTLVTCASVALQQAKHIGKNNCQFFRNDFVSEVRNDFEIEKALRWALDHDEFELFFQPQLDVHSLCINSVEALIRWRHPERGLIMPGEFIQAAETTGQIVAIGEWVLKAACKQVREWLDADLKLPVAINLSPVQFRTHNLVDQITSAVSEARIDPKYLSLEITESVIMEEVDSALETMQILSRLGHKISIDDFGTGYSSLEYLKRFPVNNLKIDRAFIKDVVTDSGDAAIVSAAISMAHSMDLQVVAEGVETEEQLLFLRNLRCDLIQGFLLGKPLPAKDVVSLIDEKQWRAQA